MNTKKMAGREILTRPKFKSFDGGNLLVLVSRRNTKRPPSLAYSELEMATMKSIKMLVAEVARRLGGEKARQVGRGWLTCCPAHDDRNPSLSLSEGNNGGFVFYCHAGCTQEQVLQALSALGIKPSRP